ncbi:hypothetical protein MRB53_034832 [Persea americana]|uniref:Uncharacterized protein n=1 Tax=Persea americana TaxID=3435 RepID=A0ACC2K305_PERAE|nr:hypothetical protein MRB53_034832 [Persea americana]
MSAATTPGQPSSSLLKTGHFIFLSWPTFSPCTVQRPLFFLLQSPAIAAFLPSDYQPCNSPTLPGCQPGTCSSSFPALPPSSLQLPLPKHALPTTVFP